MKPTHLFLALLTWALAVAQPCLPDGMAFITQQQTDNVQADHPDYITIEGDVPIRGNIITFSTETIGVTKVTVILE